MKKYLVILFLLNLFACKEEEKVPEYVWEEEQFIEVLTEFQLAEAIVRLGYHRDKDSLVINDSLYNAVFRKMNVSRAAFDSNYNYYLNDPKKMESIYEELITRLSAASAEVESSGEEKE
jgi:hypothetical protein